MIKNYEQDLEDRKKEVAKIESKKEKAEEVVKEKKKEQGKASRDLAKVEQEIREIVSQNFNLLHCHKYICILLTQFDINLFHNYQILIPTILITTLY